MSASADYNVTIAEDFTPPSNWTPGQEVDKNVGVVNTGNVDAFVRTWLEGVMRLTVESRDVADWQAATDGANSTAAGMYADTTKVFDTASVINAGAITGLTATTDKTLADLGLTYQFTTGSGATAKTYFVKELNKTYMDTNPEVNDSGTSPNDYTEVMAVQAGGVLAYFDGTGTFTYTPNQTVDYVSENGVHIVLEADQAYTVSAGSSMTDDVALNTSTKAITYRSMQDFVDGLGKYIDTNTFKPTTSGLYIFRRNVSATGTGNNQTDDFEFTGYYYVQDAATASATAGGGKYFALQYENDNSQRSDYVLEDDTYNYEYNYTTKKGKYINFKTSTITTIDNVQQGYYKIEEIPISRYVLESAVVNAKSTGSNDTTIDSAYYDTNSNVIYCDLHDNRTTEQKAADTENEYIPQINVTFTNRIDDYSQLTHVDNAVNEFPIQNTYMTGFSMAYDHLIPVSSTENSTVKLYLSDFSAYKLYNNIDDVSLTEAEKQNVSFSVDTSIYTDFAGYGTLTVQSETADGTTKYFITVPNNSTAFNSASVEVTATYGTYNCSFELNYAAAQQNLKKTVTIYRDRGNNSYFTINNEAESSIQIEFTKLASDNTITVKCLQTSSSDIPDLAVISPYKITDYARENDDTGLLYDGDEYRMAEIDDIESYIFGPGAKDSQNNEITSYTFVAEVEEKVELQVSARLLLNSNLRMYDLIESNLGIARTNVYSFQRTTRANAGNASKYNNTVYDYYIGDAFNGGYTDHIYFYAVENDSNAGLYDVYWYTDTDGTIQIYQANSYQNIASTFEGFTAMTDVSGISTWDFSMVNSFTKMFYNCSKLQSVTMNVDTSKASSTVVSMDYMFEDCSDLTTLSITGDFTKVNNTYRMINNCKKLNSIDFGTHAEFTALTNAQWMFRYLDSMDIDDLISVFACMDFGKNSTLFPTTAARKDAARIFAPNRNYNSDYSNAIFEDYNGNKYKLAGTDPASKEKDQTLYLYEAAS